jgi:copper oxidase (laccase) domain-containing protein
MPDAWRPTGGRGQLDLRAANRAILTASGVPAEQIVDLGPCSSCAHEQYFSHRASRGTAGRQLSLIGLAGAGASAPAG